MKKGEFPKFEVKKPPTDIIFIPPDSILEPYPKPIKIDIPYIKIVESRFREYILNGMGWANDQWKKGNPYARYPSEAVCVNNIRLEIKNWRESGYPDVSETSRYLLNFWFEYPRDKILWFSQREAVETLIYLYEVKGIVKVSELLNKYSAFKLSGYEEYDKYPRYAFRMATGSGKTLVMALLSVWSFFNYLYEDKEKYSRFFLFVAPNIVVYERLKKDLEKISIYEEFDLIPKEWKNDFKINIITRDNFTEKDKFPPPEDEGVIFVTNIHQIGFKKEEKEKEDLINTFFNISSPGKEPYKAKSIKLWEILANYPSLMILKDEAHHIHREESKWQNYLWDLHNLLLKNHAKGIFMELDFSATPKDEEGNLFPWIIVDFSLREALQTGIVKYPARVVVRDVPPTIKKGFSLDDFMPYIRAALHRWREHKKKLKELGRKSVLFIMADEISNAEAVYNKLLEEPDINSSNMILVHSELDEWKARVKDRHGKEIISKIQIQGKEIEINKDLAVQLVRDLDKSDNQVEVISSVMMLNEGWDVRSVTVILGLRAYESPILPEQVIGRGLRKLFPDQSIDVERWINILEVVGPPNLLKVIDNLESLEGIKIPEPPDKFFISFNPRIDVSEDLKFDIPIADFVSFSDNIDAAKIIEEIFSKLPPYIFKLFELEKIKKEYKYDVIGIKKEILATGKFETPLYEAPFISLTTLARELEDEIPLPNSFNLLLSALEKYITEKLFDRPVELTDDVLRFLSIKGWYLSVKNEIINLAKPLIGNPVFSIDVEINKFIKLDELDSFPWSKDFVDSEKSLFVRVAYENNEELRIPSCPIDTDMEGDFVNFLTKAQDVISFIKNIPYIVKLKVTYYDSHERKWKRFYPDFIVKSEEGFYLIETKGREEIQILDKNPAAQKWCEAVSRGTGKKWTYLYLKKEDWEGKESLKEIIKKDYIF